MCLRPSAARPIGREGEGSVRARRSLARREKTFRWMVVVLAPLSLSLSLYPTILPSSRAGRGYQTTYLPWNCESTIKWHVTLASKGQRYLDLGLIHFNIGLLCATSDV